MKIRGFITHKKGEKFADCQDRFKINVETRSIAVSDGMTQSIFSGKWADILVSAYTDNSWNPSQDMSGLSQEWEKYAKREVDRPEKEENVRRRLQNNLARKNGAGATLLGVKFQENRWSGYVLGDSCLVIVNNCQKLKILSSRKDNKFDNYPEYFDSYNTMKGEPRSIHGELTSQDNVLLFVTDAIAEFLNRNQGRSEYVDEILKLDSHDAYENLISGWRKDGMHDDDCTVLIVEYDGSCEFDIAHEDNIEDLRNNETERSSISVGVEKERGQEKEIREGKEPERFECNGCQREESIMNDSTEYKSVQEVSSFSEIWEKTLEKINELQSLMDNLQSLIPTNVSEKFKKKKRNLKSALKGISQIVGKLEK